MHDEACSFRLQAEKELENGWRFEVVLDLDLDHSRGFTLRLNWADYNLWSPSGSDRPSDVARAVLAIFIESMDPREIPMNLDAARIRRVVPDADTRVPAMIRQSPQS
ncbi:MAG: hypothetical protein P8M22_01500 [Phycisphaerales bacterium]|nr:hypothetical protein [Phycisphaerales bacterium]